MTKVYLMKDVPTGYFKIGKSITPVKRERTLLAQQPLIHLLCYWEDENDEKERYLHYEFREFRRRGEWFELSKSEMWRIYWLMKDLRRTDVHLEAKQYAALYFEKEWRYSALFGAQKRYSHVNPLTQVVVPATQWTEMEWFNDGMLAAR